VVSLHREKAAARHRPREAIGRLPEGEINNLTIRALMNFATVLLDVLVCAANGLDCLTSVSLNTKLSVSWLCLVALKVMGIHCVIKGTRVLFSLKPRHSRSFCVWKIFSAARNAE
jgi:hypothetical protein